MRRIIHVCGVLLVLGSVGSRASAQTTPVPALNVASFNHLASKGDESKTLRVKNGETFKVVINDTCEDAFAYEVRGFLREAKPAGGGLSLSEGGKPKLAPKELTIVYDSKYGGYFVTVSRTVTATEPCEGSEKLQPRTFVIVTPLEDWDLAFSGAFTVSSLSNPTYYLRAHPDDATKKQVQQDTDKSDAVNLGIGAFVHLFHQRLPWVAGAFGLGIREGNKMEYFLGGGLRASDKATINAGLVFGPVSRLPNGVDTTRPVSDDNVLTDLPTRIQRGFFVSISYSFIDVRNKFQAPFAGSQPGTPAPAATPSTPPAPTTCSVSLDKSELTFAPGGGTTTLAVTAGSDWTIAPKLAWLTFSLEGKPVEGGKGDATLTVTAQANPGNARGEKALKIGCATLAVNQGAK